MKKTLLTMSLWAVALCLAFSASARAEEGVTDTEILLGSNLDLSGAIASWGVQIKNGMDMICREINERGGIHGRKLSFVAEDNAYDPKKAIMATNKMINLDKVFCFVNNLGTPTSLATLPITTRRKIPALFPLAASEKFYEPVNRYSFVTSIPYSAYAQALVVFAVEHRKAKKVGILYQDDELGDGHLRGTKAQLENYGLPLAAAESYKRGATDFSSQIIKLRNAGVDFVVLGTTGRETVAALKEVLKIGWKVPMGSGGASVTKHVPILANNAGISSDGLYFSSTGPFLYEDSDIPFVREWYKRHVQWYGTTPDGATMGGYEGVRLFAVAAEKAGRDLTRERLVEALEAFKDVKSVFGGPPISFGPTKHNGVTQALILELKKDRFVPITDFLDL